MRSTNITKLALAATLAGTVAACAPGPAGSGTDSPTSGPVKTSVGTEKVTLKLVSTPESGEATKKTIAAFQSAHPNVTIEYTQTNYEDYNKSINLELASDRAPDIVLLNSVSTTVKNKLVRDLTPYVQAYGWDKVYPSNELAQWRVGPDGTTLGNGGLYAAPAGFSIVGVYYNKQLAQKIGLDAPPTDLAGLEAAMAKAKSAGLVPLQLGNSEGHASFVVQLAGQSADGPEAYTKWVFGQQGATFDTPGNRAGLDLLASWVSKGYVPASANGTDLQGAVAKFVKGEGLFFVDGNWDAAKVRDGLGDSAGFFPFPGQKTTAIGTSVAYAISSKSKNPDAAAAFLDFLHSEQASAHQVEQGLMPVDVSGVTPEAGSLQADLLAAWNKVIEANGLVGFNNNAAPTMNDTLTATTQELLAGRIDTAKAVERIQADWAATHGS